MKFICFIIIEEDFIHVNIKLWLFFVEILRGQIKKAPETELFVCFF